MDSQPDGTTSAQGGSSPMQCAVGIMAYNEASNIATAINSILNQGYGFCELKEIIVVASGCTDDTVAIVNNIAKDEPRVRVVVQEQREGKASAINIFLSEARPEARPEARADFLIMASADVKLKEGTLAKLLAPFQDETVGMVGARPIPVNDEQRFLGHAVHLLWDLHDRVARESPKLGEVVAFRNVVPNIPIDTPVDEISIQAFITQMGYKLVYEPQAVVYNRGPSTVSDFIRQRRRIYSGHLRIQKQQAYSASTMSVPRVLRALLESKPFTSPRATAFTIGAIGLEGISRALGAYDNLANRQHYLWQISTTTKFNITEVAAPTLQSVLAFRVDNFHQHEIELGGRGAQQLMQQVDAVMRHHLGGRGSITHGLDGTIVMTAPLDRDSADQLAATLVADLAATPFHIGGRQDGVSIQVSHGIITFQQPGTVAATSVVTSVAPMGPVAPATSV
ncbi:MAG TPA: glycosyltransferase [Ktedonobacterales bacterium]